ncbi:unnamed protein product (macronuclear) [Paramecium tetraurelia]|uniref:Uncharacterized protein n=1 Tax=Paramecium tetraurelia TaxID=5888 RepID=A0D888_PARTE|nr:uncharacterized protein GSPATT00014222001 [Paramecium tetraurelia]CAK79255.1 unnamed protein product [Paramecium tetraurelia]|eukprot:XP_001446652.1 hypothetical protein (macronuclear) [Paramecium tetraurelia strain d4-2]
MCSKEQQESKTLRDEVSPSIRDFITNFRKQQAQLAKQNAYQQSIQKSIPIQQITQLQFIRQSVDTQTDRAELQSDTSFKRNSAQISQRQNSTFSQSYLTTREVQKQCEYNQAKPTDDLPSTRVNFHQLHQHYLSTQSELGTQNISQQLPLIYRSPQKCEGNINYNQMTEQIRNKVIYELDKRNIENNSFSQQQSQSKSLSSQKMINLSLNNQTTSLTVIPQPKSEDEDSFIKFIQMNLVNKSKAHLEEQENRPPQQSLMQYNSNITKTKQQHLKQSISKQRISESLNQNRVIKNKSCIKANTNTNTKSNAHQRLYQDACMRQERKSLAITKRCRY